MDEHVEHYPRCPKWKTTIPGKPDSIGFKLFIIAESVCLSIIFVRGLTGDRERTWKAKSADSPWPKALLPSALPDSRIRVLTFGYDAYVSDWRRMVSKSSIGDHARTLLADIASEYNVGGDIDLDRDLDPSTKKEPSKKSTTGHINKARWKSLWPSRMAVPQA
ncbi:hypothetical protein EJ06DRAFT_519658 [Trichodelitschia bisporula]|uniref:Uncharacterized protein n=1 Tax=Trichodelitschia bisporula TaxID=703511 RepID=A0A6G1I7F3_9PEZI|nr:hypothetical protein EJ06DRAFT_519658 [Trichodelitschia bisporula]